MRVPSLSAAALSLFAASAALADKPFDYKGLGDTSWTAAEWNGAAPKAQMVPQITFAPPNRFSASAGCNTHTGVYKVQGQGIAFEHQVSTKMLCHDERGQADQRIVADLKRIARLALADDGKALVAYAADGKAIMSLRCTKNC